MLLFPQGIEIMIKNRLKVLLAERDMNISELAEATGLHYTTVYRFASDKAASIHKPTLGKICEVLKVQPGDIFIHQPDQPPQ